MTYAASVFLLRFGKVVEAMLGQIDDDAFARTRRQDAPARERRCPSAAPGSHGSTPGLARDDLFVAQAEAPREIRQRVFEYGLNVFDIAENGWRAIDELIHCRVRSARRQEQRRHRHKAYLEEQFVTH